MDKKSPAERLALALQHYVAEGGELTSEEHPPSGRTNATERRHRRELLIYGAGLIVATIVGATISSGWQLW